MMSAYGRLLAITIRTEKKEATNLIIFQSMGIAGDGQRGVVPGFTTMAI